jgi:hypothetical protein
MVFESEIATHLAGARKNLMRKGFPFLNREWGLKRPSSGAVPVKYSILREKIQRIPHLLLWPFF